jgi:hypothetical protein
MSDVNPHFVVIPAVLLVLVAYAVFQFLRQCQEFQLEVNKPRRQGAAGRKVRTELTRIPPRVACDECVR